MRRLFYARVSSTGQNLSRQLSKAKKLHIKPQNIYKEKISGATIAKRPAIQSLMFNVRRGDIVYVVALDRLSRNANDIKTIMNVIKRKGATLEVLGLPSFKGVKNSNLRALLDNLIIDIYSYQSQEERMEIRNRQAAGIKQAKANGKYKGRQRQFYLSSPNVQNALKEYFNKKQYHLSTVQIARLHKISISEFYKLIKKYKKHVGIIK